MKVSTLLRKLSKCDPDAVVVMSRDAEGNGYSELSSTDDGFRWNKRECEVRGKPGWYPAESSDKPCIVLFP